MSSASGAAPFYAYTSLEAPPGAPNLACLTVHYTPDGKYLLSTSPSSLVTLYNPSIERVSRPIQCYGCHQQSCPVVDVSVMVGNSHFASTGLNGPYRDCTVLIHDVTRSGVTPDKLGQKNADVPSGVRKINSRVGHTPPLGFLEVPGVAAVELAPQGNVLFTGGYDGKVLAWDLKQGNGSSMSVCVGNGVADVKYFDGRVVVGRTDGEVDVYDCRFNKCCLEKYSVEGKPALTKLQLLRDQVR